MTAPIVALTIEPMKPENGMKPSCRSSQTPDEGADDAEDDVPEQSRSKTAHDLPGQPAGDGADDEHDDDAIDVDHDILPAGGNERPPRFTCNERG